MVQGGFVVVCGGLWWFVVVCGGSAVVVSCWFVVVHGGSWWFMVVHGGSVVVVCGGLWWFVVVFSPKISRERHVTLYLTNHRSKFTMKSHF